MQIRPAIIATAIAALVAASPLPLGAQGPHSGASKLKKPQLSLRATPRLAFSPVNVLITAELVGGDEVEEYYCPELDWDWGDGSRSSHGQDCEPFESGSVEMERRFTAAHAYRVAGNYNIKLTMRRADRTLAVQAVTINVRPGLGDPTMGE